MSRKLKDALFIGAIAAFIVALIFGSIYWEYSLWHECRATNSFWYCMRVLGN